MLIRLVAIALGFLLISSCNLFKKQNNTAENKPVVLLDTLEISPEEPKEYRASAKQTYDIIHTKLDVKFDYQKAHLIGEARLSIKPYFYPLNSIDIDARGFEIKGVLLQKRQTREKLHYTYEKNIISISLDKQYTRNDTFTVFISYIAKPNELENGGSAAIRSDKGLYFINPDGKDSLKPIQIWTQGETQSNSAWFPTFDNPNEKITHDICMTVEDKYTTLSNGELYFQLHNADGSRTDCWKMDLPHAPYLVMMAVGEYEVVKDKWRDKEVNYYVEKKYLPHALKIFGNTPEMLEFYSKILGVDYPWNKYAQIIVRDYVSGAMENTTATIHGEFVQRTTRELLDRDYEDIIAHELFHQWFGDYVTCESWANLPLNESFATYGEYLWFEYKYGRDMADDHLWSDLIRYQQESKRKQENLIRFYYENREDMFDGHSYQKGGRILHMLRKYVGDEAFFAALKLYLEENKFSAAEAHHLRLAFEKITGEDLNWFFNQWFYSSGHPKLDLEYSYDKENKKQTVQISQIQDLSSNSLFRLPVDIDLYFADTVVRHSIVITKQNEEFVFDVPAKPLLINVDAEKMLLCDKTEYKTVAEWAYQYNHAPLYLDRAEAIYALGRNEQKNINGEVMLKYTNDVVFLTNSGPPKTKTYPADSLANATLFKALNDRSADARYTALEMLETKKSLSGFKEKLITMAETDKKSSVRALALQTLVKNFPSDELLPLFSRALNDSSYMVIGEALSGLKKLDKNEALKQAAVLEKEESPSILMAVANVYGEAGSDKNNDFFVMLLGKLKSWNRLSAVIAYGEFLKRCNDETINSGIVLLVNIGKTTELKWERYYVMQSLADILAMYSKREEEIQKRIDELNASKTGAETVLKLTKDLEPIRLQKEKVRKAYNDVEEQTTPK